MFKYLAWQLLLYCSYSSAVVQDIIIINNILIIFSVLYPLAEMWNQIRHTTPHSMRFITRFKLLQDYHGSKLLPRKFLTYVDLLQPCSMRMRLRRIINFSMASFSRLLTELDGCFCSEEFWNVWLELIIQIITR